MQDALLKNKKQFYHRWAPSLGDGFSGTVENVWRTKKYNPDKHINESVVFCGLYGLPDFFALWRHKGPKYVWFAGSDITHFKKGYWLDIEGHIRLNPEPLASWIRENCISYVENEVEARELLKFGVPASIVPSFLGNVDDFPLLYKTGKPRFYTSVSGNNFELYGWDKIEDLSDEYPHVEFHLYGNTEPWYTDKKNIFVHGRVSQSEMDREIKEMTGALRLTEFDGASEILIKSVLWGQWPVSPFIPYPHMSLSISESLEKTKPNTKGRNHYLKILNNYPWCVQQNIKQNTGNGER